MAIACGGERIPDTVIAEEEMVNILIDLHLAEAQVQDLRLKPDSAKKVMKIQEKLLYKKYEISDSLFIRSYNYYIEHPEKLEEVYTALIDTLSLRQVLLKEKNEK